MTSRRKYDDKYRLNHPDRIRESNHRYHRQIHQIALDVVYGSVYPRCVLCGSSDGLEIDHINGDGVEERIRDGSIELFYRAIITGKRKLDDLRVLCSSCNRES